MPAAEAESPDVMALAALLRRPLLQVSRRLRHEAQKVGLSTQDAVIMGHLQGNPGAGVSQLAEAEQISRPTMSSHVKRLESQGWVRRAGDAEDGRRSGLSLTPGGLRKLEALKQLRNDWLANRLARLTAAERDCLAAAAEPLNRLVSLEP